jgi:sodium pump decarboxylase gamma subunit
MGKYMIGLQLLIIGLGTVLLSLFLLSIFLRISGKYINSNSQKKEQKKEIATAESGSAQTEIKEEYEDENKGKKMAAVAAAVYQYLDNDKNYKIISIKKSDNSWKR